MTWTQPPGRSSSFISLRYLDHLPMFIPGDTNREWMRSYWFALNISGSRSGSLRLWPINSRLSGWSGTCLSKGTSAWALFTQDFLYSSHSHWKYVDCSNLCKSIRTQKLSNSVKENQNPAAWFGQLYTHLAILELVRTLDGPVSRAIATLQY